MDLTLPREAVNDALSDGRWWKSRDLVRMTGLDWRTIREVCQEFGEVISSSHPTRGGYKLAELATDEEIRHALLDLRHRAGTLRDRADRIESKVAEIREANSQLELSLS